MIQRPQRPGFRASEPLDRLFTGRAVRPQVGYLAHPPGQMRFQRRPTGEDMAGNCVGLHIADAPLVLALGASPVRCAGPRPEAPVAGKGQQPIIEANFPGDSIMVLHQRPRVVEQHLLRHAAEVIKGAFDSVKPGRLALVPKRPDITPPRIPERRLKQMRRTGSPLSVIRVSPKSICSCRPGGVSNRTVARASARSA